MLSPDKNKYGEYPSDGPYSLINGGGGRGFIWGRCVSGQDERDIEGIFNGCRSHDGRGTVIAFNFKQNVSSQHFETNMIDPISCTGAGCFDCLPDNSKTWIRNLGYEKDGKPNFAVYTDEEYSGLSQLLADGISVFSALFRNTSEVAAEITSEHAPSHIREYAKRVGALIYRFDGIADVVGELFGDGWLSAVEASDKPSMCLVSHVK